MYLYIFLHNIQISRRCSVYCQRRDYILYIMWMNYLRSSYYLCWYPTVYFGIMWMDACSFERRMYFLALCNSACVSYSVVYVSSSHDHVSFILSPWNCGQRGYDGEKESRKEYIKTASTFSFCFVCPTVASYLRRFKTNQRWSKATRQSLCLCGPPIVYHQVVVADLLVDRHVFVDFFPPVAMFEPEAKSAVWGISPVLFIVGCTYHILSIALPHWLASANVHLGLWDYCVTGGPCVGIAEIISDSGEWCSLILCRLALPA